jgi:hypothetical protein
VTSPFTTGSILLAKTHRLLVPAGLNGAPVANLVVHYLGVEVKAGSYDVSTTPKRTFSKSLGTVAFPDMPVDPLDEVCVQATVQP